MITLIVNGQEQHWDGDPSLPLLWYIRDEVGLTGTKFGCGHGFCGSCTVHLEGVAVRSCSTTLAEASGKKITTIEGLDPAGDHPIQKAWREVNVPQCGYCQSGQIMQASSLIAHNPHPSHEEIRAAMAGNICRCGCYQRIETAIHLATTGA